MTTTEKLDYIKNNIHMVADYPNDSNYQFMKKNSIS